LRIAQQSHVINRERDLHLGTLRRCRETGAIDHSAAPRFARTMLLYISLLNNESQSLFIPLTQLLIPRKGGPVFRLRHGRGQEHGLRRRSSDTLMHVAGRKKDLESADSGGGESHWRFRFPCGAFRKYLHSEIRSGFLPPFFMAFDGIARRQTRDVDISPRK
jgi:hypothetical protein